MRALITGISGQDGSFLAEYLLGLGYTVYGMTRRSSTVTDERIAHLLDQITLVSGDLMDESSLVRAIDASEPTELYNLGAQSFVPASWAQPSYTGEVTGLGVARLLEAIRQVNPKIRFLQASSSEMFGQVREEPQTEATPFYPRSPYGCAKAYAHFLTVNYRESYDLYAVSSILFNHESPRRGAEFVTRKITRAVAKIVMGEQSELRLGNLDAERDWGHASDYVRAQHLMLQQDVPTDYVVASGVSHSVREFCQIAFDFVGLDYRKYVVVDPDLFRPAEVVHLRGDAAKIRALGWEPTITFEEMIEAMVAADCATFAR